MIKKPKKEKMARTQFYLPPSLQVSVRRKMRSAGVSNLSEAIRCALREWTR